MSIKNKIVTAVTTAGLLAGLFGSAFVPAVRAATQVLDPDVAGSRCVATTTDADVISRGAIDSTCYALAGKTVLVDITLGDGSNVADDDIAAGATFVASVGGEIVGVNSVTGMGLAAAVPPISVSSISNLSVDKRTLTFNKLFMSTLNTNITVQVGVKSHATAGSNRTFVLTSAAGVAQGTLTIVSVAAGTAGVASAAYSSITANCTPGTGGAALTAVGGSTCAVSGKNGIQVSQIFSANLVTKDAYDAAITTAGYVVATLSGTATGGIGLENDGSCAGFADSATASIQSTPDGADAVCFLSDGTAGTATLTITTGPLTYSKTIIVRGSLASIEISAPTHMVADGGLENDGFEDGLSVTCKDSTGTIFGDGGGIAYDADTDAYAFDGDDAGCSSVELSFTVGDATGASIGAFTDASATAGAFVAAHTASQFEDNAVGVADAASEARNGLWDIPASVCAANKEGETRKIKVAGGLIQSNEVTLTCVYDGYKVTGLTALTTGTAGSATAGKTGQTILVQVSAEDGYGRPAGVGRTMTWTATKSTTNAASSAGTTAYFAAGKATLKITLGSASGDQFVVYSVVDSDSVTTGAQPFDKKFAFTVTNPVDTYIDYVLTNSGAKVTGSNFASRATVKVEVENATKGTVRVYTRKASASGQVVYTVVGKGTFYVTMYTGTVGNEVLSNTVTVKR